MKLKKIVSYQGTVTCVTGISIRGAGNDLGIGGADSEVIKNPMTGEPYLPGSSLKGKMRSQLEHKYGARKFNRRTQSAEPTEKEPCGCGQRNCPICTLFGAHFNPGAQSAPTRILVRDCHMTDQFRQKVQELPLERGSYLEVKGENIIDRKTGAASSPRFMERVPAGATFQLDIQVQVFEGDDEEKLLGMVEEGLSLVEDSYLGTASASRTARYTTTTTPCWAIAGGRTVSRRSMRIRPPWCGASSPGTSWARAISRSATG